MYYQKIWARLAFGVLLFVASCASALSQEQSKHDEMVKMGAPRDLIVKIEDPYIVFNRAMYAFNDKLDLYVLKPVATVYNMMIPRPLIKRIANFFSNINLLPTIFNDILQMKLQQTLNDIWRIGINSTVGIGGLFDVATAMKLRAHHTDFGLTLAKWGYRHSSYIVLPFWGPSTIRDGLSMPLDYFIFSICPRISSESLCYTIYGTSVVSRRAALLNYQNILNEVALDRYIFMRNAYFQYRAHQMEPSLKNEQPI